MDGFDRLKRHLDGPPRVAQLDFANEVGLSQSLVSMLANKLRQPPLSAIPALNEKLGTRLEDWLLERPKRGARKSKRGK